MRTSGRFYFLGVLFAAFSFLPLATAVQVVEEPFIGVRRIQQVETSPRPLYINVVEIDLDAPGLSFQMTPGGPHPRPFGTNGIPMETIRQTTRQFANAVGAQVAINGSFFSTACSGCSQWANNLGLTASGGEAYSPWEAPFTPNFNDALNITQDNEATIVKMPASIPTGFETNPPVTLFNTVTGSHRLLANGVNVAPPPGGDNLTLIHPRTAVGLTADNRLLLMTVDGRQTGFSEGVNLVELANLMANYGAVDAINLDGGGSTTMAINHHHDADAHGNPFAARLANSPSESERSVGTNLAVFAAVNPDYQPPPQAVAPPPSTQILGNFEINEGRFSGSPTASPMNAGVSTNSRIDRVVNESHVGEASQRLVIRSSNPATPGINLVHLSGGGLPSNNPALDSTGFLGFYAKVHPTGIATGHLQASLLVNDGADLETAALVDVVADGQWHLYQWDLASPVDWINSPQGSGEIDQPQVTLHGLNFQSQSNLDFTVFIDMVAHNPQGKLAPDPLAGDFNGDGLVDATDYQLWRNTFGQSVAAGTGADGNQNGVIDAGDFTVWRDHLGVPTANLAAATVPEPATRAVFCGILLCVYGGLCRRRRLTVFVRGRSLSKSSRIC